jgi:hypothetical protein
MTLKIGLWDAIPTCGLSRNAAFSVIFVVKIPVVDEIRDVLRPIEKRRKTTDSSGDASRGPSRDGSRTPAEPSGDDSDLSEADLSRADLSRADSAWTWDKFYKTARDCNKDGNPNLSKNGISDLRDVDQTFQKLEKEEIFPFPEDDNRKLRNAVEALNVALKNAPKTQMEDNDEVKDALKKLRKA